MDVPQFEGNFNGKSLDDWLLLSLMRGKYLLGNTFNICEDKITFITLKFVVMSYFGANHTINSAKINVINNNTWKRFVEALHNTYYSLKHYDDMYMKWPQLH
jgi:hypothetical protein